MILLAPTTPSVPAYTQRTALDGRDYLLEFGWNARDSAWYLHLSDERGASIRAGIRIVCDFPLLRRIRDPRVPPGSLMAIDSAGAGVRPGYDELGTRVRLYYLDAAELAELAS